MNPFGIGDVLFTTPLIRALRQAFPATRIGYLCNRRTEGILRENPHLDELFVYEKDEVVQLWRADKWRCVRELGALFRRIRAAEFDLIVDLSLGERYGLLLKLLGAPRRMGFDFRHRGKFLTERLPIDGYLDRHVVEYYRQLLRFMGIGLIEASLELRPSADDERWAEQWMRSHGLEEGSLVIGVVPAGGVSWGVDASFRRWSMEGFAAVADLLIEQRGARVILFGERTDATMCAAVAQLMRHPILDLSGHTTLGQFVSLLKRMDLVICNDGGPLHLAVSQGVRTVSIFGPVDPTVYGPYPTTPHHRVVMRSDLPCRPCYHRFRLPPCPYERACLTTIGSDEVLAACQFLLDQKAQGEGRPMSPGLSVSSPLTS